MDYTQTVPSAIDQTGVFASSADRCRDHGFLLARTSATSKHHTAIDVITLDCC
jgi:hypothetical protein